MEVLMVANLIGYKAVWENTTYEPIEHDNDSEEEDDEDIENGG